jgi:type II secretory pathway pseudopilin PulG
MKRENAFTVIELLIAMAMTVAIMASALALAQPAQAAFRVQLESVDVTQRLRAAADALTRDILMAGSGLPAGVAGVTRYTTAASEDGLTVRYVPNASALVTTRSYYVTVDADSNLYQLRRSDGETDVPVVDHIASAVFSCFDDAAGVVASCGDAARIRRVRVTLRVQAVMQHMRTAATLLRVPGQDVVVDVAPRGLETGG